MHMVMVRHGQSVWNLDGRLQGQTMDIPLTDLGREQAQQAAEQVAALVARPLLVSSDQVRALQTAHIIAERIGVEPVTTKLAREHHFGELEGRTRAELHAQPVPEGQHINEIAWGGGESVQELYARCARLLDHLRTLANSSDSEELVLVSHGDALRVLLAVIDDVGHREVEWRPITNGEVITRNL